MSDQEPDTRSPLRVLIDCHAYDCDALGVASRDGHTQLEQLTQRAEDAELILEAITTGYVSYINGGGWVCDPPGYKQAKGVDGFGLDVDDQCIPHLNDESRAVLRDLCEGPPRRGGY